MLGQAKPQERTLLWRYKANAQRAIRAGNWKYLKIGGNEFLSRAAQSLNVLGQEFRKTASETPNVISTSIADHRIIVEAIRRRDAAAARQAMITHMDHVLQSTEAAMKAKNE